MADWNYLFCPNFFLHARGEGTKMVLPIYHFSPVKSYSLPRDQFQDLQSLPTMCQPLCQYRIERTSLTSHCFPTNQKTTGSWITVAG